MTKRTDLRAMKSEAAMPSNMVIGAKQRLFNAAQDLIAEQGFDAISTRDIVARAETNIAAVNYYFGSKNQLLLDIFRVRAAELNRERIALLAIAVQEDAGNARGILRALIEPATLWIGDERRTALRFLNRARTEGPIEVRDTIRTDVRHLRRFVDALANALPGMGRDDLIWRFHFALGVLHHNQASDYQRLAVLSEGLCDPDDREALLQRLLDFVAGGFGL